MSTTSTGSSLGFGGEPFDTMFPNSSHAKGIDTTYDAPEGHLFVRSLLDSDRLQTLPPYAIDLAEWDSYGMQFVASRGLLVASRRITVVPAIPAGYMGDVVDSRLTQPKTGIRVRFDLTTLATNIWVPQVGNIDPSRIANL